MKNITFEQLPQIVGQLSQRLERIEGLLNSLKNEFEAKPSNEIFTVHETADFLNLKVQTVYKMVSKGEIPVMKRSKRLYFSKSNLLAWLREGKRNPKSEIDGREFLINKK